MDKTETILETITPEMALNWLSARPDFQRKVDEKQVRKLAHAIRKNEWRENGATIVFDDKGNLLDGQHRLHAISISNKPIKSLVVRGISGDETTFTTIGDEKPRRITDFLNCKHSAQIAGSMRFYWATLNGQWPPLKEKATIEIPIVDLIKITKPHIEYLSYLVNELNSAGRLTTQPSFCLFICFWMSKIYQKDIKKTSEFFARLGDGVELKSNSPIYKLRQRFINLGKDERLHRTIVRGLILKAFNLYLLDQTTDRLQWTLDKEEFPSLPGFDKKK